MDSLPVSFDDVKAARSLLEGIIRDTPVQGSRPLSERVGGPVWLKCENLQRTGSFKIRGAYTRIARLDADERARGVITYSSGNHAQGVARAARLLGAAAVVVMPSDAPGLKKSRVEADGAEVVVVGTSSEERQGVAERIAAERGLAIIPPYDDDRIIAGQGTVGLEIAEDLPDVAAVLVPIGGGGLGSGVATAVRSLAPAAASSRSKPIPPCRCAPRSRPANR